MAEFETPRENPSIIVTGATGYVGGRLIPRLLEKGYRVRAMVRGGSQRLAGRPRRYEIDVVDGDVFMPNTLIPPLQGVDIAYYLLQSMRDNTKFRQRDISAARNFAQAAKAAGVQRIIYLRCLGDPKKGLSGHPLSHQATGKALREAGIPVTEFRAGIIVGSGSLSFEMVRHLTERMPVMICPRWVFVRTHPIAIRDVLDYLVKALEVPGSNDQILEIGGADVLTVAEMMRVYARIQGIRRQIIPVPIVATRLSSYWVHWITPIPANIARPLIVGLRQEVMANNSLVKRLFPDIQPMDYNTAVTLALRCMKEGHIESIWSDTLVSSLGDSRPVHLTQEEGLLLERRQKMVDASHEIVFKTFSGLGGERG